MTINKERESENSEKCIQLSPYQGSKCLEKEGYKSLYRDS